MSNQYLKITTIKTPDFEEEKKESKQYLKITMSETTHLKKKDTKIQKVLENHNV